MKGIIFNVFEQYMDACHGEGSFLRLCTEAQVGLKEPFVGPGTYSDEALLKLVQLLPQKNQLSLTDTLRHFGRFAFHRLAERFPKFVEPYTHPKPFLMSIDGVIHVEINKLYRHAYTPSFKYKNPDPSQLIMEYSSKRELCSLAHGLLEGTSEYFEHPMTITQERCTHRNDPVCEFFITFSAPYEGAGKTERTP